MPVKIAKSGEVKKGHPCRLKYKGEHILLVRTETGLYAVRDVCPHIEQSLADGTVKDRVITCRHHGVQIDLKTGKILVDMGFVDLQPVAAYAVHEKNEDIIIDTED